MVWNLTREVPRGTDADPTSPWISAIGLAISVGIAYFIAGQLSLAVLAKSGGLAFFWLAGGVSAGALIALGRDGDCLSLPA
jgi:hypothetical protein